MFFSIFAIFGGALFHIGCAYLSAKFKQDISYSDVKKLARKGNVLATFLLWLFWLSILSAVFYGSLLMLAFL